MPKSIENYSADAQDFLLPVARSKGREYAEEHARLIPWESWTIGMLTDTTNLDGCEVYAEYIHNLRKGIKPKGQ